MAKKEKKPQEQIITLFEKDYKESELSEEQKVINHVADLDRKIQSSEFNLQQLRFGKQAFLDALKASVEKDEEQDQETK